MSRRPYVDMPITVRPLGKYPKAETPATHRKRGAQFRSSVDDTLKLLRYELYAIGAARVELALDYRSLDLRVDGWPRADARPLSPRVIVSFDLGDVGRVSYPCDTYASWSANVHAVALSLEALRAVDRHGVTTAKREQYRGFTALPPGRGDGARPLTPKEAAEILVTWDPNAAYLGDLLRGALAEQMLETPELAGQVARRALGAVHPDAGGKADDFHKATLARDTLTTHHGGTLG